MSAFTVPLLEQRAADPAQHTNPCMDTLPPEPKLPPADYAACLCRRDALAATLQASASLARKSGHLDAADTALSRIQQLIRDTATADSSAAAAPGALPAGNDAAGAAPGGASGSRGSSGGSGGTAWWRSMARPQAPWLLEAVKLMWDRGQTATAVRELQSLITSVESGESAQAAAAEAANGGKLGAPEAAAGGMLSSHQQLACMLSLAGKWQAKMQHGGGKTATVMELMVRGAEALVDGGGERGELACTVFFRLAAFADERYK